MLSAITPRATRSRFRRSRAFWILALLVIVGTVSAVPTPASAYVRVANAQPTTMGSNWGDPEGTVRAVLPMGEVRAGQTRNLRSEIVVGEGRSAGVLKKVMIGHKITCQPVGGSTLPNSLSQHGFIWSGQNLAPGGADLTLVVRFLFTPAQTGNYECLLRAYVQDFDANPDTLATAKLRSGFIGDVDGDNPTSTVSDRFMTDRSYIPIGAARTAAQTINYTPVAGATSFFAFGDLYVTTCYNGPIQGRCGDAAWPLGTARVSYQLVATPEHTTSGCVTQSTPVSQTDVNYVTHHQRLFQKLTVTVPAGGCGVWTIRKMVGSAGGDNPFELESGSYNTLFARTSY